MLHQQKASRQLFGYAREATAVAVLAVSLMASGCASGRAAATLHSNSQKSVAAASNVAIPSFDPVAAAHELDTLRKELADAKARYDNDEDRISRLQDVIKTLENQVILEQDAHPSAQEAKDAQTAASGTPTLTPAAGISDAAKTGAVPASPDLANLARPANSSQSDPTKLGSADQKPVPETAGTNTAPPAPPASAAKALVASSLRAVGAERLALPARASQTIFSIPAAQAVSIQNQTATQVAAAPQTATQTEAVVATPSVPSTVISTQATPATPPLALSNLDQIPGRMGRTQLRGTSLFSERDADGIRVYFYAQTRWYKNEGLSAEIVRNAPQSYTFHLVLNSQQTTGDGSAGNGFQVSQLVGTIDIAVRDATTFRSLSLQVYEPSPVSGLAAWLAANKEGDLMVGKSLIHVDSALRAHLLEMLRAYYDLNGN